MRSAGKSMLLACGAAVAHASCIGPVLVLLAGIGCAQRIIAINAARRILVRDRADEQAQAMSRAWFAAIAEAACWVTAALAVGGALSVLPKAIAAPAEEFLVDLWFGTAVLSLVACWATVDTTITRYALDVERRRLPAILALASVPPLLVAAVIRALPAAPSGIGGASTVVGALLWAAACVLLAHQATSAGDELAGGPRRRVLRTPEDSDEAVGPARRARPRPADDDAPIPLD